jgi:hypothetical protein
MDARVASTDELHDVRQRVYGAETRGSGGSDDGTNVTSFEQLPQCRNVHAPGVVDGHR